MMEPAGSPPGDVKPSSATTTTSPRILEALMHTHFMVPNMQMDPSLLTFLFGSCSLSWIALHHFNVVQ
jgi:hypothetical protein